MELDDNKRSHYGVVSCLRDEEDELRLIFDDVKSKDETNPMYWEFKTFFTWKKYDKEKLLECDLSDEQYKEIGINLIARLGAIYKQKKD